MNVTSDILNACKNGNRKAIEALYEHCFKVLMPVCMRYHNHEEDARSSLNIGFMKLLKGLETVDEKVNFAAWSKRIIVNTLIDEYRKKKNYASYVVGRETERELESFGRFEANKAENNLGYENLLKLIEQLPTATAKVFNLYVIDGYNHREIGELLEMSEGTSKWHLSTARKLLREKLEKIENHALVL